MDKKALGTYEIAEICQVTPSTVGNWIDKGLLPTFSTAGGHRRVWAKDLAVFLDKLNIPQPEGLIVQANNSVLIVDDEDRVRSTIRRILHKLDPRIEIYEACDGFEAGQKIALISPTVIILDLKLPGLDGYKVCKNIRSIARLKYTKILTISGHDPAHSREQSISAGSDDFLAKPFTANDFREKFLQLSKKNKA